jgi:hypothetical protein
MRASGRSGARQGLQGAGRDARRRGAGARARIPADGDLARRLPARHAGLDGAQPAQAEPATRHIPVQIVTLDEDRQHGLARGAFSFVTKPTTTEGLRNALSPIKEFAKPRRKRLLVVEDNAGRADEHRELCSATTTSRSSPPDRRRGAGGAARAAVRLRRARPAAAGHVRLRGAGEDPRDDAGAARRAGRGVHRQGAVADEDAQLHTMARSIVVKGVESPERLLDETALFLHRVVADLPPRSSACWSGCTAPTRIWSAARCCWSTTTRATSSRCQRAGAPRHEGADRDHRREAIALLDSTTRTSRSC